MTRRESGAGVSKRNASTRGVSRAKRLFRRALIAAGAALLLLLGPLTAPAEGADLPPKASINALKGTTWFGVYVFGKKAGFARAELARTKRGYELEDRVSVSVKAFGVTQHIRMLSRRTYDARSGRLRELDSQFERADQKVESRLLVRGSKATLTQRIAGVETTREIVAPGDSLADALSVPLLVRRSKGKKGATSKSVTFEALPPFARGLAMEHEVVSTEQRVVDGVPVRLVEVRTRAPEQGLDVTSLLRPDGTLVSTEMMGMLRLRREPEATAKSQTATPDVLDLSLARPDKPLKNPSALTYLRMRLALPKEPSTFSDGHVHVRDRGKGWVEVELHKGRLEGPPGKVSVTPPEALEPTDLIQSKHPRVAARARAVTAGAKSTADKARRLVRHVHGSVRKEYRAALSNALEVLNDPAGDCTEHSVYFVALARAAGVPARLVVGLAYTQEGGGGFGGHAWAEVLISGRWVPVDPTFGQAEADAAHIPLAIGNLGDIGHVAALLGRVKVRVMETRY